jgi:hypothetical protein
VPWSSKEQLTGQSQQQRWYQNAGRIFDFQNHDTMTVTPPPGQDYYH